MKWLDPIRPYLAVIRLVAFIAVILVAYLYGRADGKESEREAFDAYREKMQRLTAEAADKARLSERSQVQAFNRYDRQYQEGLARARKEGFDSVVAGVLSGGIRLRDPWSCAPAMPGATAGSGKPDAAIRERAESAARVVLAARECDLQVTALQGLLACERGDTTKCPTTP